MSGPLPNAVFGLGAIPVDEFAMAWDQAAALPVCDLLGMDAAGFELDAGPGAKGSGVELPRHLARCLRNISATRSPQISICSTFLTAPRPTIPQQLQLQSSRLRSLPS